MSDSILCGAHINGIALDTELMITLPDGRLKCKICGEIMRKSKSESAKKYYEERSMKQIQSILERHRK